MFERRPTVLVLSRRPEQRVQFPDLNISVEVLQVKGNNVRLGIQAPADIRVLREELLSQSSKLSEPTSAASRNWNHDMRGRLNSAVVALYVVEKQLRAGMTGDAEATLQKALQDLLSLDQALAAASKNATATQSQKAIEALLVEDNPQEEALLASYLRLNGIKVETAHDGLEALEFLSTNKRPDFMLLDMRLPRCDGPATLSAIRRNPQYNELTIFGVTGTSPDEVGIKTGPGGVDGWFLKPLNPARIVEAMQATRKN